MYITKNSLMMPTEKDYQMLIKGILNLEKLYYQNIEDYRFGNYLHFEISAFYEDDNDEWDSAFDDMMERMEEVEQEYKSFNWEVLIIRESDEDFHFIAYDKKLSDVINILLKYIKSYT